MKASEARKQALNPQYAIAKIEIAAAVAEGKSSTCVYEECGPLFSETADLLAKDGYDVKIFVDHIALQSANIISWANAKSDRVGTVQWFEKNDEDLPK